ncbi:MAG: lactonase family protein [Dehalococcoidia bacterium]|nr:lactonase family protein [Dehalococcoidia bacterium]
MRKGAPLFAVILPLLVSAACSSRRKANSVFVMTNAARNNTVRAFSLDDFGILVSAGSAETQGSGAGSSANPLNSQGALAVSGDSKWLIALNAGSNDISILSINNNGKLTFASKSSSIGQSPISVATHGSRIFVLNSKGMSPNITGFSIGKNGDLKAIDREKAVRQLPPRATCSQIGISPNGRWLVVSNESDNRLIVYSLSGDNIAREPLIMETSGGRPAAFAFDKNNNVIVVESSSGTVSSYALSSNGISVITAALSTGQTMPRWIACNGNYAYTSAPNSGAISTIAVDKNCRLTRGDTFYADSTGVAELSASSDGAYLYVSNPRTGRINRLHIGESGKLSTVDGVDSFFGISAQGIAAN